VNDKVTVDYITKNGRRMVVSLVRK